jgi:hypothetical protein
VLDNARVPDAPRSPSEAVAAVDEQREEVAAAEVEEARASPTGEAAVEETPAASRDELREFLGVGEEKPVEEEPPAPVVPPVVEPRAEEEEEATAHGVHHGALRVEAAADDPPLEPGEPQPPTLADLQRLLTADPEFAAAHSPAEDEFGPWVEYGDGRIPLSLLRMMQRGVIRGWT